MNLNRFSVTFRKFPAVSMDVQWFCLNMDVLVILLLLQISPVFCGGGFSISSMPLFSTRWCLLTCRVSDQLDRRVASADRYPLKHRPWEWWVEVTPR